VFHSPRVNEPAEAVHVQDEPLSLLEEPQPPEFSELVCYGFPRRSDEVRQILVRHPQADHRSIRGFFPVILGEPKERAREAVVLPCMAELREGFFDPREPPGEKADKVQRSGGG